MCIEYNLLKGIVQYLPFVLFTFGIGSLACSYIVAGTYLDQAIYLDYFSDVNSIEGLIVTLNVLSSFLISAGLCGIVGNQKRIPPLSVCYNIGNMLMIIGFLVLTILSFTLQNSASWNNIFEQSNCNNQKLLYNSYQLDQEYQQAEQLFCKNSTYGSGGCQCYYYISGSVNPTVLQNYTSKFLSSSTYNYQECKYRNTSISYSTMNYFQKVEDNFNCAGWCTYYPIYVFSNVNYGTPKKSCYAAVTQTSTSVTNTIAVVSITIFSVLIVILTFVLLLCCHPNKKEQTNLIFRMNHYD